MIESLLLAVTVVVRGPAYNTSLANNLVRWLGEEKVAARTVAPERMSAALASERLAFLVGFDAPTPAEMNALRAFRAHGGKLVVFHCGSSALGDLMGVKPVGYRTAAYPGEFSRMVFYVTDPPGVPRAIRQNSAALQRARPIEGRSRTIAGWADRNGRTTGEPAWISSKAGLWMTHVLLSDGDEDLKAQLLGAIAGSVDPKAWSPAAHNARAAAKQAAFREYASRQRQRPGEIHAVWDHSGCGLYPRDWPRTMRVLQSARVTDVFVNVAGAGFAHYPSAVLPRSKTAELEGDQLAACIAAARGTGVRVHAWILCFTGTRSTPDRLAGFARRGWRLKDARGRLTEYLNPGDAAVRSHLLAAIGEIQAKYAVGGIHLDFVRWGDAAVKPGNAAATITQFVAEVRRRVDRRRWLTAAVYGKYPECVASVGQDWGAWLDAGLLDYAVPMNYTGSLASFEDLMRRQASSPARAGRTICGIGVTANESRLNARQVIDQILLARKHGLAGEALFDLDVTLEKSVLPYLALGAW